MAFQLKVSNSLEQLAAKLCIDLQSTPQDVFQPIYIITQTEGMNNWLKIQMADRIGIAANCQYLKPNDLINKIYYLSGGAFSQTLSVESLNWLLFKLLGEDAFIKKYPSISGYYFNGEPDNDVKRMALAEKISDLFDQYQIYRPEMIQRWNDDLPGNTEDDEWQNELWVNAKIITEKKFPDKTLIGKAIEHALENPDNVERLQKKMPVIYLFGISLITEYHLQIFQELAKYIDIEFLLLNPAPSVYWFEDKSEKQLSFLKKIGKIDNSATNLGNPLLTSWGRIIQDTFSMLFKNDDLINAYDEIGSIEPLQDSLLHKIQYAVFQNEITSGETRFTQKEIQDGSIIINSCYSPAREVEVLYNYLVHLVDKKDEKLSPRDIVVMVSDINLYASYIKAIFNNATYKFNYTIADESFASSDSISNALHAVLSITEDNFTAEEVIGLLDSSFIRKRFQITDLTLIRNVLNEANIRFGIDGNKEDDSVYISWNYGLKRIMYGICMGGSEEFGNGPDSFYPVDMLEGSTAHEIIRFVHFAEQLMTSIKERKQAKTIAGWVEYVDWVLHSFICKVEETTDEDYTLLLNQLENYNSITELFEEEVNYEVFMHSFLATLTGATRKNSFAVAGITFCSLIPMRSIPFKVVALLGLNFDKFPRKENSLGFNLMEKEKRKGDRNVKENDKHLFLETVLSAKKYLYISFIGQSVKDNSNIPPSTLVDELVDYIATSAIEPKLVREALITRQPLHGFSQKYAAGNSRLYSYLGSSTSTIKIISDDQIAEGRSFAEVSLDSLISFLKNPFKGYYNKVLGIYYNDDEISLRDTEIFELDHLQKWSLKNRLLTIGDNGEKDRLKTMLVKTGDLPLKNMAEVELQNVETDVIPVRILFRDLIEDGVERKISFDIELDNYRLVGNVNGIYDDDKLVVVSWSKRETKYLLEAYIRYLALRASGNEEVKLYFISCINESVFEAVEISKEKACMRLKALLDLYVQGHKKILSFDPDFEIRPSDVNVLDDKLFQKALKAKFHNYNYPCTDTYMNKEYANEFFHADSIIEEFKSVAEELLIPLEELFPEYYK